jgi:asparagine synthetase B (glutamine-hydrolysing)
LLAWSRDDAPPDTKRWTQSVDAATRYGGDMVEFRVDRAALGAWRRPEGEFPISGRIVSAADVHVAWVGQCVDDAGDASREAIQQISAPSLQDSAVSRLNGPFAAAMIRTEPFEVRVLTDRHRHYPIYFHQDSRVIVASTELRCVAPWLDRAELDLEAVDMLLRCGELIDEQTLLRGVRILSPGSVLTNSNSGLAQRRYWSMHSEGRGSVASNADDLGARLVTGIRRQEAASTRPGITLSGGLDSRIILDLCRQPERIPSFTWGLPGCRDIVCAEEFAALVRSPHVVRHWEPEAFPALWARGVDLTGGSCGVESMFMLPFVALLASRCDVVFNGLAGDVILGGNWLKHAWLGEPDIRRLGHSVWRWRVPEAQDRLVDRLMQSARQLESATDRWVESIAARRGGRPIERLNDWLIENRIFRTTNCGTMLLRGGVESHSPFFDRDFIDALSRVRQEHKVKHRLYLAVMNRVAPRAASVRWQRTNVRPARGYYANLAAMAAQRVIARAARPFGLEPFGRLKVADVPAWLRGPWRAAVEGILLNETLYDRGFVRPEVVRELWSDHLAGADHSRQISALVAVELFARTLIDRRAM